MSTYLVRRLLLMVPTLIGITLLAYVLMRVAPGSPIERGALDEHGGIKQGTANQARLESELKKREAFHLDRNPVIGYLIWASDVLRGDLGHSIVGQREPVVEKMWDGLKVTIPLNLIAVLISYSVSIPLGIYAAVRHNSLFDMTSALLLFILYSIPGFVVCYILLWFFSYGQPLEWFPTSGLYGDEWGSLSAWGRVTTNVRHAALPIVAMTIGSFTVLSRFMRAATLDVIRQDYVRTARAKGLHERTVVLKHVLRNGVIPIITILAGLIPGLIGGAVLLETIFGLPGIGRIGFNAVQARDYPMLMGTLLVGASLTLGSLLLVDIAYVLVDPRITFGARSR